MHLIQSYAATSGLQIDKPYINTKFFPVPYEKYIILHAGGSMSSKRYDYYSEVLELLTPLLEKENIVVLQIGDVDEQGVNGAVNYKGATNLQQTAFLIKNSILFFGNDSCNLHFASGFNIPIVGLYGSTTTYNHGPYFSSANKTILLTGDLKGNKPSYLADEQVKVINSIKPEEVVGAICKLLNIGNPTNRNSLFFGHQFNQWLIELIPNCVLAPSAIPDAIPLMRMDYEYNEEVCIGNLSVRRFRIVTNKPIDVSKLAQFKKNIDCIIIDISPDSTQECLAFANQLKKSDIPYILTTLEKGEPLNAIKFAFFDHDGILERTNLGEQFIKDHPEITEDCLFKTNKLIFSKEQVFLSKPHWQQDLPAKNIEDKTTKIILTPDFFDFSENFYIFR